MAPSAADQALGDGRYWVALKATLATAQLTGIDGFSLYASAISVELNQARGIYRPATANIGAAELNWNTAISSGPVVIGSTTIDFTGAFLEVDGTVGLDIGSGLVVATGSFTLTKLDVATGTYAGDHALKLTVSSLSVFAGVGGSLTGASHDTLTVASNAVGISITGVQLTLGALTHGTTTYTGLELSAGAVTLHGLDSAFPLYISNVHVIVNRASTGSPIDWSTVDGLGFSLSDTSLLDVRATLGIDIGNGFVVVSGTVHLTTQVVSGGVLSGPQTAVKLTVTDGQLWAGVGGSLDADHHTVHDGATGISAHDVSITYANVVDGLTSYTGFELTVGTATLVGIPGVTLFVTSLDIKVNQATGGTSPTPLDWSTLPALAFTFPVRPTSASAAHSGSTSAPASSSHPARSR